MSKSKAFLDKKAIIRLEKEESVESSGTQTKVLFRNLIIDKPVVRASYNNQTIDNLKKELIAHYLPDFCENRNHLPKIKLEFYVNDVLNEETAIHANDIPKFEKKKYIQINYSTFSADGKEIIKTGKNETFKLKAYRIDKEQLATNSFKLVSKGEIAQSYPVQSLGENDHIDNHRYLFLLSGNYLTSNDGDTRGELNIPTREEFKKKMSDMYANREAILLDDIKEKTNKTIEAIYQEIKQQKEDKERNIAELQRMFLLDEEHLRNIKIGINDTDDQILNKVYEADAKVAAKRDAQLKRQVCNISKLNPSADSYDKDLMDQIDELVKTIPLQNRTALTKYVARRKLVLDVFDKILFKQLIIQKTSERNIDEKLLHNLIFQQSSDNPEESDLWLINEDFIYFKGNSEYKLNEVEVDGTPIFKDEFTKEEEEYLNALGENRKIKKPDVLLFPEEGKCIIIEFKNPDVNVGEHLNQINRYASLIRNFTCDEFQFDTFYGYFIGQSINNRDVRSFDGDFKPSYQFEYLFRPAKTIPGDGNRSDGSLYTEVIKYSTLLERAKNRNKIFIEKLTKQ